MLKFIIYYGATGLISKPPHDLKINPHMKPVMGIIFTQYIHNYIHLMCSLVRKLANRTEIPCTANTKLDTCAPNTSDKQNLLICWKIHQN